MKSALTVDKLLITLYCDETISKFLSASIFHKTLKFPHQSGWILAVTLLEAIQTCLWVVRSVKLVLDLFFKIYFSSIRTFIRRVTMKGLWIWFSNLSCLLQILGIIPSTLLMLELLYGNKGKCNESYFTRYNTTHGCSLTDIGRIIVLAHYGCDCVFALFIVSIFLIAFFQRQLGLVTILVCCGWFLIPIAMPVVICAMLVYTIVPQFLLQQGSTPILFYALWLRLDSTTKKIEICCGFVEVTTLQKIVLFVQVVMLFFENVVEIFTSVNLFIQGYWTIPAIIFAVPPGINTIVRLILVIVEWIGMCCETFPHLLKDIDDTGRSNTIHPSSPVPADPRYQSNNYRFPSIYNNRQYYEQQ